MSEALAMAGGAVFWTIALAFAAEAVLFVVNAAGLRAAVADWGDFLVGVGNVFAEGHIDEALAICDEAPSPVARMAACALRHRELPHEAVKERVDAQCATEIARCERRLAPLAIIAHVAPLLGLFGATTGLMRTVAALNASAVAAESELTGGVLAALACVAAGVLAAIAGQVMYGVLAAQTDRMAAGLEAGAGEIACMILAGGGKKNA